MTHSMYSCYYLGCFFVGFYFLFFGIWNGYHWQPTLNAMLQKKLPYPKQLLLAGILIESLAGLMLIFNIYVKVAALLLIPFDIVAVFIFHAFWAQEDAEMRRLNMIIFIANLTATLGALLLILTL